MVLPLLALGLLLLSWLLRRRDAEAQGGAGPSPGYSAQTGDLQNLTTGETYDTASAEAQAVTTWANTLGTSVSWMYRNLDRVEEWAYSMGAPDDWAAQGWPTACGPANDPKRHCAGLPFGSEDF